MANEQQTKPVASPSQAGAPPVQHTASSRDSTRNALRTTQGFDAQEQMLSPNRKDEVDPVDLINQYADEGKLGPALPPRGQGDTIMDILRPRMLRNSEVEVGANDISGVGKLDGEGVVKEAGVKGQLSPLKKPFIASCPPFAMKGEIGISGYTGTTAKESTLEVSAGGSLSFLFGQTSEAAELNVGIQGELVGKGGSVPLEDVDKGGTGPRMKLTLEASLNMVANGKGGGAGVSVKRPFGQVPVLEVTSPPLVNGKWKGEPEVKSIFQSADALYAAAKEFGKTAAETTGDLVLENTKVAAISSVAGLPGVLAYGGWAMSQAIFGESAEDKAARKQLDVIPDGLKGNRMEDDHIAPTVGGYAHPEAEKEVDPHDAFEPRIQAALAAATAAGAPFNTTNAADPSWWKNGALQVWNQGNSKRIEGVQLSQRFKAADDGVEALGTQAEATFRESEALLVKARQLQFGG